ncbi:MAG TPA: hypothetical protein ENK19_10200 [Acidobacteria bacterium]|nr:hypothetical protein [Acidobacteriota bacterium]
MELRWEELEKAHRNLRQIYLYLHVAVADANPGDVSCVEPLKQVGIAARTIATHLQELARNNGIEIQPAPLPSNPPGQAHLDHAKLQAVTAYMNKILQWIESATDARIPDRCREPIFEVHALLEAIERISSSTPADEGQDGGTVNDDPLASIDMTPSGPEAIEVPDVGELVLEHTFQEPLLRGVEGKYELTQRAIKIIDEFFDRAEIEYAGGERRRLHRKIARWLEATPDGMVLTLRIGGLSGRAEPYPKYRPRTNTVAS